MEIIKTDISDKLLDLGNQTQSFYIEVVFKKEIDGFDYLYVKNYYTSFITVMQFDANKPDDNNWVPVLEKYRLMENSSWDFDSEKIHLIDKKFFTNLNTERLKFLRIYLIQESDKWKNYDLTDIKFIRMSEKDTVITSSEVNSVPFKVPNKPISSNQGNLVLEKEESNKIYLELMKSKNHKDLNLVLFK